MDTAVTEMKLDVGCGESVREGYIGVDVRAVPGVQVVCEARHVGQHFAESSVAAVHSRHFLEHLPFVQAMQTLLAFHRVLRPGATVEIIVPDLRYHVWQYLSPDAGARSAANPSWTARSHAIAGFWGWQREADVSAWDVHKSGYDDSSLGAMLSEAGFVGARRLPDQPWNLHVLASKPH